MNGLKMWMTVAVVGLLASQAQAQTVVVPGAYYVSPVVAGPIYTPVPYSVRYVPAYQYVAPAAVTYSVPSTTVVRSEVVPTVAQTVTEESTTTTTTTTPAPVTTSQVTQTSYYVPATTYVAPAPVYVAPRRIRVNPWTGVVRIRY